ncbi:hypothetical protein A3K63_02220 [Candidatus Micrarchaeota archaeon RBG_16_49_10]|nr:MAG: hypothetical protein A3K63_02220 [Candidatus Micrarchaeota archaeon RBG_16_49_10]
MKLFLALLGYQKHITNQETIYSMKITFTAHAERKIKILKKHGINLVKGQIEDVVKTAKSKLGTKYNRFIAQKQLDKTIR